jgi:glycosyltransferase involved in cell wall biosynthesis
MMAMGVPESRPRPDARRAVRARHGIAEDAVVFMAFGKVTPEKRLREALRALSSMREPARDWHLLLAGERGESDELRRDAAALGVEGSVTWAGYVDDTEIDDYLAAADIGLCMRWPTSRETSASWLRCLAAGKPTISTDLVHTTDIPALDPRDWSVLRETGDDEPVGVSIDIVDEDHSLGIAVARLAADAALRRRLGAGARTLWQRRFRLDDMVHAYVSVIKETIAKPAGVSGRTVSLPKHLQPGLEYVERTLQDAGLPLPVRNVIAGANG